MKKKSEPGFVGLRDYLDFLLYVQNRGNHKIPLILVLTVSLSLLSWDLTFLNFWGNILFQLNMIGGGFDVR